MPFTVEVAPDCTEYVNELALWVHILNKGNGLFGCEVHPGGYRCRGHYPAHLEES